MSWAASPGAGRDIGHPGRQFLSRTLDIRNCPEHGRETVSEDAHGVSVVGAHPVLANARDDGGDAPVGRRWIVGPSNDPSDCASVDEVERELLPVVDHLVKCRDDTSDRAVVYDRPVWRLGRASPVRP